MVTNFQGQSFGSVIWDCENQSTTPTTGLVTSASTTTIKGDFRIVSTNALTMSLSSGSGNQHIYVMGHFMVEGGTVNIKTSTASFNLWTYGNLNISTGATVTQTSTNTSTTINFGGIGASFTNNGTFGSPYWSYAVRDTAIYTISSVLDMYASRSFTVNSGGTLYLEADIYFQGAATFTLNAGGNVYFECRW